MKPIAGRRFVGAAVTGIALLLACGESRRGPGSTVDRPPAVDLRSAVAQPQLVVEEDGTLLVVWRHAGEAGSDLYIARRLHDLEFSPPLRINDDPATVSGADLDGLRAAVATGPGGAIAVAWSDERGDVRVALGRSHGERFDPSVRLNQDGGKAMQSFVSIALDRRGALHAVWLDTRVSGTSDEEPADLYYARLRDGVLEERNLTDDASPSVCGCCRPDIGVGAEDTLGVAYRNTSNDGYRDIFRIDGEAGGRFESPRALGPPLWKIDGCPMAGPIVIGPETLWNDASTGTQRTLRTGSGAEPPEVLLEDRDGWRIAGPPRPIASARGEVTMLLVPGQPSGRLLTRDDSGAWRTLPGEIPGWAVSGALVGGRLLLAGSEAGALKLQTHSPARSREPGVQDDPETKKSGSSS